MRAMSTSSYHGHLVRSVKVEDMWEVLFLVPAGLRSLWRLHLKLGVRTSAKQNQG